MSLKFHYRLLSNFFDFRSKDDTYPFCIQEWGSRQNDVQSDRTGMLLRSTDGTTSVRNLPERRLVILKDNSVSTS